MWAVLSDGAYAKVGELAAESEIEIDKVRESGNVGDSPAVSKAQPRESGAVIERGYRRVGEIRAAVKVEHLQIRAVSSDCDNRIVREFGAEPDVEPLESRDHRHSSDVPTVPQIQRRETRTTSHGLYGSVCKSGAVLDIDSFGSWSQQTKHVVVSDVEEILLTENRGSSTVAAVEVDAVVGHNLMYFESPAPPRCCR